MPLLELDWAAYSDETGRRVETVRRTQSVSQDELAAVTGLSRTQIQNIEASRGAPKKPAHPTSPAKRHTKTQAVEKSNGNATLHSIFLIAQALGVPPKMLIPDGVPDGDYRSKLDQTWSTIELNIIMDVTNNHPLPPTTRTSPLVKPPVALATINVPPVRLTTADRVAIAAAAAAPGAGPAPELPPVEPEPEPRRPHTLKPPPPKPNSPTAAGSLLRTPPPKRRGMVRHDPI